MIFRKRPLHKNNGRGTIGFVQRNCRPKVDIFTHRHLCISSLWHFVTLTIWHFGTTAFHMCYWDVMGSHGRIREDMRGYGWPQAATGGHIVILTFQEFDILALQHFGTTARPWLFFFYAFRFSFHDGVVFFCKKRQQTQHVLQQDAQFHKHIQLWVRNKTKCYQHVNVLSNIKRFNMFIKPM